MSDRYSRNAALLGADGQAKIAAIKVAVIGLGGLGSHVVQQLAYLGVADIAVVDFDIVTDSSLNRLVGAVDADVAAETKKVDVARRLILSVNPGASVTLVDGRVMDIEAQRAVARADVAFGCIDRDIHRVEMTELCSRYAKPYFDLATDTVGDGETIVYGGRIVFCDGTRCLICLPNLLDQEEIARDRMNPEQRDADRRIYGVDSVALSGTGPSVVSINGVVASLAVTEFMVFVTGLREPVGQLTYRGDLGVVRASLDPPNPDCYYCKGLWGSTTVTNG